MTATRLWLVRHAQPQVAPGICYGRLDVPADPAASRFAAQALARALPAGGVAVWHSPLQRCELLALDLQGLRPDLMPKPEPRIMELDFGCWEGQAWHAIDRSALDAWAGQLHTYAPGGGEALQAMLQRVWQALQDARRLPSSDVVWITHAGVARCVAWLLAHGPGRAPRAQDWPTAAPPCGGWTVAPLPPPEDI
ncbi:histidine phosphatase family protein [Pulveribacter suum]|uniref:Phosphoglycerate kinase n=1 Tax=Pulveribacter suum TaxID=2116657 RepID=A0A2P1NNY8_9BURK|nr:histidine phosphatase family protein [Pulveribacter suum]AVP58762.1 phosphoglycerate kinase [Pulveribacter suum]